MTVLEEISERTIDIDEAFRWHSVCRFEDLQIDRGVCVLVGVTQVALYLVDIHGPHSQLPRSLALFGIDNRDPVSRASVLARGIVGSVNGEVVVASPMYKQRYSLRTGACVDDPARRVSVFSVRVVGGVVEVAIPCEPASE